MKCILFDFDGTLAHSEPAYERAYREAMLRHTGIEPSVEDIAGFINVTAAEFSAKFPTDEVRAAFEELYYETHHESLVAFDGVPEVLRVLRTSGLVAGVVSLKPRRAGELELDLCGLRDLLDVAVWGDDVRAPKPAPDGTLQALACLGVLPEFAMIVGDSPSDIAMGHAAGVRTAGALWGGASRLLLEEAGAGLFLETPRDLLAHLGLAG